MTKNKHPKCFLKSQWIKVVNGYGHKMHALFSALQGQPLVWEHHCDGTPSCNWHHRKDISIVTAKIRLFKTFSSLCFSSSVCSSCLDLEKKALYTSNSLFFLFLFHFLPSHLPQSSTYHSDKWSNNKVSHLTPCILLKNHPNYCVMGPQREKSLGEIYPEGTGIVHLSIL